MKRKISDEEKAASDAQSAHNRKYAGFKRTLKRILAEEGRLSVQLQLEYLERTPNAILPNCRLTYGETVLAFKEAIEEYMNEIRLNAK